MIVPRLPRLPVLPSIPKDLVLSTQFQNGLKAEFAELDDRKALDFYIDGANNKDCPHSMLALASFYKEGRMIYKCDVRSYHFINLACEKKDPFIDSITHLSPSEATFLRERIFGSLMRV